MHARSFARAFWLLCQLTCKAKLRLLAGDELHACGPQLVAGDTRSCTRFMVPSARWEARRALSRPPARPRDPCRRCAARAAALTLARKERRPLQPGSPSSCAATRSMPARRSPRRCAQKRPSLKGCLFQQDPPTSCAATSSMRARRSSWRWASAVEARRSAQLVSRVSRVPGCPSATTVAPGCPVLRQQRAARHWCLSPMIGVLQGSVHAAGLCSRRRWQLSGATTLSLSASVRSTGACCDVAETVGWPAGQRLQ